MVDEDSLPDGHAELFDELHGSGWYIRSRWGDSSVRFWPEGGRGYQITIDLRYPVNDPRREEIAAHIEFHQPAAQPEGGQ